MENSAEVNQERHGGGQTAYLNLLYSRWRMFHIVTLLAALICAFIACFSFVMYHSKFQPRCPLYAELRIKRIATEFEPDSNKYIVVEKDESGDVTVWGHELSCSFILYVPLVSMLLSVVWILVLCIKGTFSPSSQQNIIRSTCMSGFLVMTVTFGASIVLTRGGSIFCESFRTTTVQTCANAQYVQWINFTKMHGFYDYLLRAQITFWLTTHTWFFHFIITLIRCISNADYVIPQELEFRMKPCERLPYLSPAPVPSDDSSESKMVTNDEESDDKRNDESSAVSKSRSSI